MGVQFPTGDPLLKGRDWVAIKAHWRRMRGPCARCGGEIDYDQARRYWRSLDIGHIVSRQAARAMGWTKQQTNALSNTQPEHQRCNRGASSTTRSERGPRRWQQRRSTITQPTEAIEW
jgi:hypothetical protein